jgi:hypothetical protein
LLAHGKLAVLAAVAGLAGAQQLPRQRAPATASLEGILRNSTKLGLGGATVVLRNVATGETVEKVTAGDGGFRFQEIAPGRYELATRLEGFETWSRADILLNAGDAVTVEAELKPLEIASPLRREVEPGPPYRNLPESGTPEPENAADAESLEIRLARL